jgi:hypothetical protein
LWRDVEVFGGANRRLAGSISAKMQSGLMAQRNYQDNCVYRKP